LSRLKKKYIAVVLKEEAKSVFAGFHVGHLSWLNWNLEMLVFVEKGKQENLEKNPQSKARTNNKLNQHITPGWNQTETTLVGGEHSHHSAILASH